MSPLSESELVRKLGLITNPERKIVTALKKYARFGPAYFVQAGHGRIALVVHDGHELRRIVGITYVTWRGLQRHGLVTVANESVRIEYYGRKHLDSRDGELVTLTENGKAL